MTRSEKAALLAKPISEFPVILPPVAAVTYEVDGEAIAYDSEPVKCELGLGSIWQEIAKKRD